MRVACAIECLHLFPGARRPCRPWTTTCAAATPDHPQGAPPSASSDALLTIAFEILADEAHPDENAVRAALVSDLARAGGHEALIGGQMMDIEAQPASKPRR